MYFMLIGDIVNSKKITNRVEIQQNLENVLNIINNKYNSFIEKNLTITLGDEFQGAFINFEKILEIIDLIQISMSPIKIRFGIGYGSLLVNNNDKNNPFNTDGEAWWNARDAIEDIKYENSVNKTEIIGSIRLRFKNKRVDMLGNEILSLLQIIKNNWTKSQKEIIKVIIEKNGLTYNIVQKEIAGLTNKAESTINEHIKNSYYFNYVKGIDMIKKIIKEELE